MEIYFSRHAKKQMRWRKISEEEVKDALQYPEEIKDSINYRKNAFKHINEKWLKVTFKKEDAKIIVITVLMKANRR